MEMNYCRRCGKPLENVRDHIYTCAEGHSIYANAAPAVEVLFVNDNKEVLMAIRAIDPGKGRLDVPGGFCDGAETFEAALEREMQEEIGVTPDDYDNLAFLCSYNDPYDYKGERIPVLTGVFTAHLKSGTTPQPADDVAEVHFMKYADIDQDSIQFESLRVALGLLHARGVI